MTNGAHLDGNSLGGLLHDLFGQDMTGRRACCGACGTIDMMGAAIVYRDAPGDVVRCRNCGAVALAAVSTPSGIRISFQSLRWIEIPPV